MTPILAGIDVHNRHYVNTKPPRKKTTTPCPNPFAARTCGPPFSKEFLDEQNLIAGQL